MASRTSPSADSPRRAALRAMLPTSMQKLRIVEIHSNGAAGYGKDSPTVFYNVATPDDLARVLDTPPNGDPAT